MTDNSLQDNPLLVSDGLPRFDQIQPEHVIPGVREMLRRALERVEQIEKNIQPTWAGVVQPLSELDVLFEYGWSPVRHLFGVKNSPELRQAYEAVQGDVDDFILRLQQSQVIYDALKEIRDGKEWPQLDEAQQRIISSRLLSAELTGIGLIGEPRERFNEISKRLTQLGTKFSNNVLDSIKAWSLIVTDPAKVAGLPESLLQMAAHGYNEANTEEQPPATPEQGPWRFTLEIPCFVPFMKHCRDSGLREQMYRAYMTKAAGGDWDNTPIIKELLTLRGERAQLLGYHTFAETSLVRKMAPSVEGVEEMLETLRVASWKPAERDMQDLQELAAASGQSGELKHWDISYWSERLREKRFDYTEEEIRPYFSLKNVLEGLFELLQRLFGVTIEAADGQAPVWHPDVRFFYIQDESGQRVAAFYLDPYSRPKNKRSGAWMDDCLTRRWQGNRLQIPVAHLVCNSTPPVGDKPSLMTFREVETLFHEFGHGLQHMLTRVDYPDAAGISNIEWDAVELPSQFMENWCYHKPTLLGLTAHYQTGQPLPEALFEKIAASRTFQAGTMMLRQLQFGLTDLELHHRYNPQGQETVFEVQRRIGEKTSVLPLFPENRFLCSFEHIFSGGYAAGYFSYKWAEVLSADAFSAFEDAGLDNEQAVRQTGRRFRDTVLALGGSRHPMEVFKAFRGREPSPAALLRHNDLA